MSPAFFNSELLLRYKSDKQKYQLDQRSIYCRGAWNLKTYDVNDVGQVHTYLRYLRDLPYQEQLYWQSFNEWPKGPISRRAYLTDFEGEWSTDYEPLTAVKQKIAKLDDAAQDWWKPRGEALAQAVHYPVTKSEDEWVESILALDQLVIEGFQEKPLRGLAAKLGRKPESGWRSLKLLEECLLAKDVDEGEVAEAI